jgi:hypothetical protein
MGRLSSFSIVFLLAAASSAEAQLPISGGPPPSAFMIDWPGDLSAVNPRMEEHALALFEEDAWNRAPVCPLSRAADQPSAGGALRCEYAPTAILPAGNGALWAGVALEQHEHDGMYSYTENVVLVVTGPYGAPIVAHTLVQWRHHVPDCFAEVSMRRQRVLDLDGDGETEMCIESVAERGAGLFAVMDLGDAHRRWFPAERSRGFSAWTINTGAGRLVRRSTLDAHCPRAGYAPFVPTRRYADAVGWRAGVQGADARGLEIGRRLVRAPNAGCAWESPRGTAP